MTSLGQRPYTAHLPTMGTLTISAERGAHFSISQFRCWKSCSLLRELPWRQEKGPGKAEKPQQDTAMVPQVFSSHVT